MAVPPGIHEHHELEAFALPSLPCAAVGSMKIGRSADQGEGLASLVAELRQDARMMAA
jgi:hypothetical protein